MADLQIRFRTKDSISGKTNLTGRLDLYNDSSFPNKIVAKGLRDLLKTYTIMHKPLEKGLIARCFNSNDGKRRVRISAYPEVKIWGVEPKEDAPRKLCKDYQMEGVWVSYVDITSKDAYYNIKIGKTHLNGGPVEHPLDHGFDDFLGFIDHTWDYLRLSQNDVDHYGEVNARRAHIGPLLDGREKVSFENDFTTDIFSRKTVEVIQNKGDRPLYIQLEYNAVHHPTYICHPDYLEKYGIDQFPYWDPEVEPYLSWHRKWGHLGEVDPDGRKRYLLQLEVLDAGIGNILDALEASGELENTIIFFMSDNGGELSTYSQNDPLNGYKYMFGEGGIRVPMIIAYPKLIKEQKYVTPKVSLMDVVPTILETIGVDLPEDLDGKSLWPAIEDDKEIHDYLVWSNGRETWVVRKGAWKLARNIGYVHNTYELVEGIAYEADSHYLFPGGTRLIDLDQDMGETTNVAKQFPEVVRELEQIYLTWRSEMSDPRTRDGELKVQPHPGNYIGNSLKDLGAEVWADGSVVDNYPGKVIDGYDATFWKYTGGDSSKPLPHYIIIDLKSEQTFSMMEYIPAPDQVSNRISTYNIYVSDSPVNWGDPVISGKFPDNSTAVTIDLGQPFATRYVIFEATGVYGSTYEVAITSIDINL